MSRSGREVAEKKKSGQPFKVKVEFEAKAKPGERERDGRGREGRERETERGGEGGVFWLITQVHNIDTALHLLTMCTYPGLMYLEVGNRYLPRYRR